MYKEHWIHSLLYFKFVELTLNYVRICYQIIPIVLVSFYNV